MGKFLRLPVFLGVAAIMLAVIVLRPYSLFATGNSNSLTGWAWSDTIGWISFNCLDLGTCGTVSYGISVDQSSGTLSGYAWSEYIGWISANSSDLSGCPSNPCTAKLNGNNLQGWMKALSASGQGWDGWISLKGSSPNYGPTLSGNIFSGYAWGSDVVGWISFSGNGYSVVNAQAPTCSVTFDQNPITSGGGGTTVRWNSSDAVSFSLNTIGAVTPNQSSYTAVNPVGTTDYSGTAYGSFGTSASCPATLTVQCAETYTCNGQTIRHTDTSCNTTNVTTCVAPQFCLTGASTCQAPSPSFSGGGELRVSPQRVNKGHTSRVFWSADNVTSCTVTGSTGAGGNGDSWTGTSAALSNCTHAGDVNSCVTAPINEITTYTLHCTGYDGASPPSLDASVEVSLVPIFEEK